MRSVFIKTILCLNLLLGTVLSIHADTHIGDLFPSLSGSLTGDLPDTQNKIVLVDFWATWCAPCKASFPVYKNLQTDFNTQGFIVVAVSVDTVASAYTRYITTTPPGFFTIRDTSQTLVKQVNVPVMPTSYLLGKDGRVKYIHMGFHSSKTELELRKEITTLLAEKN
jgi:thiol-disulfide isomerase/thioredoxin